MCNTNYMQVLVDLTEHDYDATVFLNNATVISNRSTADANHLCPIDGYC